MLKNYCKELESYHSHPHNKKKDEQTENQQSSSQIQQRIEVTDKFVPRNLERQADT